MRVWPFAAEQQVSIRTSDRCGATSVDRLICYSSTVFEGGSVLCCRYVGQAGLEMVLPVILVGGAGAANHFAQLC